MSKKDYLYIFFLLLGGLALRLDFLIPCNFAVDADEAIVGLMAKHILEGKEIPTFYYGQHYMGSLEAILTALIFKFFGISNITLKIVPLVFSLLLIPLVFLIGLEIKNVFVARVASLFTAFPPVALIIWSSKTRGGFIELVFIGALALYLSLKELHNKQISFFNIALINIILGLGWWTNNQIVFFIIPIYLVINFKFSQSDIKFFEKSKDLVKYNLFSLFFFFLGGLPFWVYNLKNKFISFEMFKGAKQGDILEHFFGLLQYSLPILFGAKRFWETYDIFPNSTLVFYLLYLSIILYYLVKEGKKIFNKKIILIIFFLLCNYGIFVGSSFGHLFQAPRYLLPSYIGIFCLLALAVESIKHYSTKLSYFLIFLILTANLTSAYAGGRAIPGEPVIFHFDRVAKDHSELITWLKENNINYLRTNYWIGYRLAFETKEEIKFLVFQTPKQTRIQSYKEEISSKMPKNLVPLLLSPTQANIIETALKVVGVEFRRKVFTDYVLFYDLKQSHINPVEISCENFIFTASQHPETVLNSCDKDLKTRWATGEPQKPGMSFSVELKSPVPIRGINILDTNFETDFPRDLDVTLEGPDGISRKILDSGRYQALIYYEEDDISLYFPAFLTKKITLVQKGKDSFFDWSISEIIIEK